jgi:hypothetical protein
MASAREGGIGAPDAGRHSLSFRRDGECGLTAYLIEGISFHPFQVCRTDLELSNRVNTDIHPFTRQYLKATPWEDGEIYTKTSPMRSSTTPSRRL